MEDSSSIFDENEGYNYNKAVVLTIHRKKDKGRGFCDWWQKTICLGCFFQILILFAFGAMMNASAPVMLGLAFLEKEPDRYECHNPETDEWNECGVDEICDNNKDKSEYRPVHDDEYIENWVEKYDLTCESKFKIGLFGSCFFVGVVSTLLVYPPLSDKYGRKIPYLIAQITSAIG